VHLHVRSQAKCETTEATSYEKHLSYFSLYAIRASGTAECSRIRIFTFYFIATFIGAYLGGRPARARTPPRDRS